jgi:hypothetical protein
MPIGSATPKVPTAADVVEHRGGVRGDPETARETEAGRSAFDFDPFSLLIRIPPAFILSMNLKRRHMSAGQQAMAHALIYPEPEKGGR